MVQGCPSSLGTKCKHPDALKMLQRELEPRGYLTKLLGGGRIVRHKSKKEPKSGYISIFGYSKTFGPCEDCNSKTCELLYAAYPEFHVRWSNQGYFESDEYKIKDFISCGKT